MHKTRAMPHKPQLIGSLDAADTLGIDRSTLIRWVAAGKLTPAVRVSDTATGAWMFKRADVERLAKSRGTVTDSVAS